MEDYIGNDKEKSPSVWSHAASGGLVLGCALVLLAVIDYTLGLYGENKWLSGLNYLTTAGAIVFFTIQFRDKVCGGIISYKRSLLFGVLIAAFSSILSGAFLYVLVTLIDPNYLNIQLEKVTEKMMQEGSFTQSQVDMMEKSMSMVMNPLVLMFSAVIGGALVGLIISLITSIFTKRE